MLPRANENVVAGHMWPVGRYLPIPGLEHSICIQHQDWGPIYSSYAKSISYYSRVFFKVF